MNEKYLLGIGAATIIISFSIIISFAIAKSVEQKVAEENTTIGFEQLSELNYEIKERLKSSKEVQQFKSLLGNLSDEMNSKITKEINGTVP